MSTFFTLICSILILVAGLWGFTSQRKHLLIVFLSLEFISLSLFLLIFLIFHGEFSELYICLLFLTFVVCEGSLGLSILVSIARTHGNDFLNSIIVLQC